MRTPLIPPSAVPTDAVILDARPSADDYARGHLAGARHAMLDVHLAEIDDPSRGGRHPLPPIERWTTQLGEWGIGRDTNVVIYDDQQGANAAARAWWMLRAVGHESVAVIDGDWREAGPLTADAPPVDALPPYPAERWQLPTVDMARVDELRSRDDWRVLDVRAAERFRGETEPIDPIAGHIPGAINVPFAQNMSGGRFKSAEELRALYAHVDPQQLVVHCGSGVTACHTLLALEAAGLRGASLYVGSWSEWCRNDKPRVP